MRPCCSDASSGFGSRTNLPYLLERRTRQGDSAAFQRLAEEYQFNGKPPLREAVIEALDQKPKILERKKITERIVDELLGLDATFDDGLGGI